MGNFGLGQVDRNKKILIHETLFNAVIYGSNKTHIVMHNLKT